MSLVTWVPLIMLLDEGLEDLVAAHWTEVAHDKKAVPLAVNWESYLAQEKAGYFKVAAQFRGGKLVGYNSFFIHNHMHYQTTKFAVNDAIFVDPDHRGIGGELVRTCETLLANLGVKKVLYHAKLDVFVKSDKTVGDLLEAMGYTHVENVYGKVL